MIKLYPTIAFVKPDTNNYPFVGKLVNWWCNSKYYHCELILGDYWITVSPDYGVKLNEIKQLDTDKYDYVPLKQINLAQQWYDAIIVYIRSETSDDYDTLGIILNQIFGFNIKTKKWFCSELVADILMRLGYEELKGHCSYEFSPQDLYDIFTGKQVEPRRYSILSRIKRIFNLKKFYISIGKTF